MWPSQYTWDGVMANITSFLQEPVVFGGVLFGLALPMVVWMVRSLRGALSMAHGRRLYGSDYDPDYWDDEFAAEEGMSRDE